MSDKTLVRKYPLNCPFCDEPAFAKDGAHRMVTPFNIYTLRECPMGHTFYSVEFIPENQSRIVEEINEIKEAEKDGTT
jgi:hypothetical protein